MKRITLFVTLFGIWLLLTWSRDPQQVIAGLILCAGLAFLLARIYGDVSLKFLNPLRWIWFVIYLINFIYFCIKANLDVAYRVLHPDLPIRPAIIKVQTTLQSDIAKTLLANSITLTPGTLTVDITGTDLYIHWINVVTEDPQEQNDRIVKRFEDILRRVFE